MQFTLIFCLKENWIHNSIPRWEIWETSEKWRTQTIFFNVHKVWHKIIEPKILIINRRWFLHASRVEINSFLRNKAVWNHSCRRCFVYLIIIKAVKKILNRKVFYHILWNLMLYLMWATVAEWSSFLPCSPGPGKVETLGSVSVNHSLTGPKCQNGTSKCSEERNQRAPALCGMFGVV